MSVEARRVADGDGHGRAAAIAIEKPLRRDAERNRKLILEVAAKVFAEKGLDAGFDEIARRAGVGAGTVYRRFPHRDQLVEAMMVERLEQMIGLAHQAIDNPDAWAGLVGFLETSIALQIEDRGLRELLENSDRWAECSVEPKSKLVPLIIEVLARAKAQGHVRADVEITDIGLLATLISSIHDTDEPELWRRYLALFLDGLRVHRAGPTALPVAHRRSASSPGSSADPDRDGALSGITSMRP